MTERSTGITVQLRCSKKRPARPPDEDLFLPPHLEVIPEGPVPQHLEEGVVVGVTAHVLQVVVLPPSTHTFLAVHHSPLLRQLAAGICRAQENGLELESTGKRHKQLSLAATHAHAGRESGKGWARTWFMPELTKRRVGSPRGRTGAEGRQRWPCFSSKKRRKAARIRPADGQAAPRRGQRGQDRRTASSGRRRGLAVAMLAEGGSQCGDFRQRRGPTGRRRSAGSPTRCGPTAAWRRAGRRGRPGACGGSGWAAAGCCWRPARRSAGRGRRPFSGKVGGRPPRAGVVEPGGGTRGKAEAGLSVRGGGGKGGDRDLKLKFLRTSLLRSLTSAHV